MSTWSVCGCTFLFYIFEASCYRYALFLLNKVERNFWLDQSIDKSDTALWGVARPTLLGRCCAVQRVSVQMLTNNNNLWLWQASVVVTSRNLPLFCVVSLKKWKPRRPLELTLACPVNSNKAIFGFDFCLFFILIGSCRSHNTKTSVWRLLIGRWLFLCGRIRFINHHLVNMFWFSRAIYLCLGETSTSIPT